MTTLRKSISISILLFTCLLAAPSAKGQSDLERDAGFVDFGRLDALFPAQPRVEVNVKGSLLRLVVEASRHEDARLAEVLSHLRAVQVRMYELPEDHSQSVAEYVQNVSGRLTRTGWETAVRVRGDEQNIDVQLRDVNDLISGLMVTVLDNSGKTATFVNIVGNIDPAEIALIGRKFDIQPLSNLDATSLTQ